MKKWILLIVLWLLLSVVIGLVSYWFFPEWLAAVPLLAIVAAAAALAVLDQLNGAYGLVSSLTDEAETVTTLPKPSSTVHIGNVGEGAFHNSGNIVGGNMTVQTGLPPPVVLPMGSEGGEITAVSAHLTTITELESTQKLALVAKLLATPTMSIASRRDAVVGQLAATMHTRIQRDAAPHVDVVNIVNGCLNYPKGLAELITIVHFFEGDSLPMRELSAFLLTL